MNESTSSRFWLVQHHSIDGWYWHDVHKGSASIHIWMLCVCTEERNIIREIRHCRQGKKERDICVHGAQITSAYYFSDSGGSWWARHGVAVAVTRDSSLNKWTSRCHYRLLRSSPSSNHIWNWLVCPASCAAPMLLPLLFVTAKEEDAITICTISSSSSGPTSCVGNRRMKRKNSKVSQAMRRVGC